MSSKSSPTARRPAHRRPLGDAEHLRALVEQAWELRRSPYLIDAVDAIVEWYERRPLRALEQQQESLGRLVRLLRETNPRSLSLDEAA